MMAENSDVFWEVEENLFDTTSYIRALWSIVSERH
jgi:hypothetical protein